MLLFEVTMLHRLPSNQPQRLHKQLALRSVRICQQSVLSGLHGTSFGRVVLVGPARFHPQCGFQYYPFGNEPRCYLGHKSYSVLSHRRYDCLVGQALKSRREHVISQGLLFYVLINSSMTQQRKTRTNTYSFHNETVYSVVHIMETWTAISMWTFSY